MICLIAIGANIDLLSLSPIKPLLAQWKLQIYSKPYYNYIDHITVGYITSYNYSNAYYKRMLAKLLLCWNTGSSSYMDMGYGQGYQDTMDPYTYSSMHGWSHPEFSADDGAQHYYDTNCGDHDFDMDFGGDFGFWSIAPSFSLPPLPSFFFSSILPLFPFKLVHTSILNGLICSCRLRITWVITDSLAKSIANDHLYLIVRLTLCFYVRVVVMLHIQSIYSHHAS